MSHSELMAALARVRHVALDMDGTIYLGSRLFDFTKGFLQSLTQLGIGYSFLTNNPTRSIADYLTKLAGLGIDATPEQMYTTSTATIEYIKATMSGVRTLFVVGTPSMEAEFRNAGFELTACNAASLPDALVVAFDTTLTYDKMCRAAYLAQQGVPYIATNPDRVCPTDLSTVLPDCGSLCKAIEYATGRKPDIVIASPTQICLLVYAVATVSLPRRLLCAATASTPMWPWLSMPAHLECLCCREKRLLIQPWRPSACPMS